VVPRERYYAWWLERFSPEECTATARAIWGWPRLNCHSQVVAEARSYHSVWLTLKGSDTVDEFYKYTGKELPKVGEVIQVVRFLRDRPTRARVTQVDTDFQFQPRITAIQID
jgi:hypothetical protein